MQERLWRVLVVEDDAATSRYFADCVELSPGLCLAAIHSTVADALAWLNEAAETPDVLLVDLGLPDGSGLEVIRHAVRLFPFCEPLVISMFGDEENVLASIEAGALGYIHKDAGAFDIAQTILQMKNGASPISPMLARRVLSHCRSWQSKNHPITGRHAGEAAKKNANKLASEIAQHPMLSPREQDVLELISRGFSYLEIARLQSVSVHTVQTHIKNLYHKLAVHSRSEAVFEASRLGLLAAAR
jgi:DNA-binding NarL/FixJ family response regulator